MSRKTRLTEIEKDLQNHLPGYPQDAKSIIEMVIKYSGVSLKDILHPGGSSKKVKDED